MTPVECVKLVAYLAARCPAMRMEDATPDVWYDDLRDVRFVDAQDAIKALSAGQRYVSLNEILAAVRAVRNDRIEKTLLPAPPPEIADDTAATKAWLLEQRRDIADGLVPSQPELPAHPVAALLSKAFKGVYE